MFYRFNKINKIALLLLFVFLISGCQSKLEWLDKKIGEEFNKLQSEQNNVEHLEKPDKNQKREAKDLIKEEKEKIDKWLDKNNLNRYGDSRDTMYIGGTPLFNEAIGESIDRYEYILDNHAELWDLVE